MAESFDAVLAEMRRGGGTETGWIGIDTARQWADRLQSAHEAEVAERDAIAEGYRASRNAYEQEVVQLQARADRAVGLLREVSRGGWGKLGPADLIHETPLLERIDAFLSEQAGERENGE